MSELILQFIGKFIMWKISFPYVYSYIFFISMDFNEFQSRFKIET